MRGRFWNNLIDLRFKAYYYECYAAFVSVVDTILSIFLAVVTSATVAAWLDDKERAGVCALVIVFTQVVSVVRAVVPSLRKSQEYIKCALAHEKVYNACEVVWFECEKANIDEAYGSALAELRERLHRLECANAGLPIWDIPFLTRKARRKIDEFMRLNFS